MEQGGQLSHRNAVFKNLHNKNFEFALYQTSTKILHSTIVY